MEAYRMKNRPNKKECEAARIHVPPGPKSRNLFRTRLTGYSTGHTLAVTDAIRTVNWRITGKTKIKTLKG